MKTQPYHFALGTQRKLLEMRRRNLDEDQTIGRGKLPNARTHLKDFVKRHGRVDFFNLRYVRCEMRVGELILPRDVANKSLKTSRREEGKASYARTSKRFKL